MKAHRFYYVGSKRKTALMHRAETKIAGNRTFCGMPIRLSWAFWTGRGDRKMCEKCDG